MICPEIFEQNILRKHILSFLFVIFILWFRNFREFLKLKIGRGFPSNQIVSETVECNQIEREGKNGKKINIILKRYILFYIDAIANGSIFLVSVSSLLNVSDVALRKPRLVNVPDAVLTSSWQTRCC